MSPDSELLQSMRMKDTTKKPAMLEFAVPETAPFLVSSSRALFWIPRRSQAGSVRAAVRPVASRGAFYLEIVKMVALTGQELDWGNIQRFDLDGLQKAVDHVRSYDLTDLQILCHPNTDWGKIVTPSDNADEPGVPDTLCGYPVVATEWLEPGMLVVVPRDRAFLGFIIETRDGEVVSVVHNASRGMGIAAL